MPVCPGAEIRSDARLRRNVESYQAMGAFDRGGEYACNDVYLYHG